MLKIDACEAAKHKIILSWPKEEVLDEQIKKVDRTEKKTYSKIKKEATKTKLYYQ